MQYFQLFAEFFTLTGFYFPFNTFAKLLPHYMIKCKRNENKLNAMIGQLYKVFTTFTRKDYFRFLVSYLTLKPSYRMSKDLLLNNCE